jgi:hypothetical protein
MTFFYILGLCGHFGAADAARANSSNASLEDRHSAAQSESAATMVRVGVL